MKSTAKPYRLINSSELNYFQQNFSEKFFSWNKEFSFKEIRLQVIHSSAINHFAEMQLLANEHTPIALLDSSYLLMLKNSIFADSSDCFNQACNEICLCLLKQFFAFDSLQFTPNSTSYSEWIYPGSACLTLIFTNQDDLFNLYLHPNWVLAHLPQIKNPVKPLVRLDEVLATKKLCLTVQLEPLHLSLEKLLGLQVGDVIKTDHSLAKPLDIQYLNQTVCTGIAGQHQTIQLRKSS